jgi:hypothetical protein
LEDCSEEKYIRGVLDNVLGLYGDFEGVKGRKLPALAAREAVGSLHNTAFSRRDRALLPDDPDRGVQSAQALEHDVNERILTDWRAKGLLPPLDRVNRTPHRARRGVRVGCLTFSSRRTRCAFH